MLGLELVVLVLVAETSGPSVRGSTGRCQTTGRSRGSRRPMQMVLVVAAGESVGQSAEGFDWTANLKRHDMVSDVSNLLRLNLMS